MSIKKIYVNGGILVNTRFFACKNVTCLCSDIPEDAEYIDPPIIEFNDNSQTEKLKCLLMDDEHPQSLFTEYYCKTIFTSYYEGIDYLNMTPENCFNEFNEGIDEARMMIDYYPEKNNSLCGVFYKMVYLHVISCLDSYICSIILSKISHDEALFLDYYEKLLSASKKAEVTKLLINFNRGKWERGVIDEILHLSFCNIERIKKSFKLMEKKYPNVDDAIIKNHFKNRHLLMHRNGKMLEGGKLIVDRAMAESVINDIYKYGEAIFHSL